jgi:putative transposase
MTYNYRYRLTPTERQRETLDYHRDTCRQLCNHALYRFTQSPESEDTVKQRVRNIRDELPDRKDWWDALTDAYSKVFQPVVILSDVISCRHVSRSAVQTCKYSQQSFRV